MKIPTRFRLEYIAVLLLSSLFLGCQVGTLHAGEDATNATGTASVTNVTSSSTTSTTSAPAAASSKNAPPPKSAPPVQLSPEIQKIVEMAESGVSDDVLMAFITNSPSLFQLNSDQIVYLSDVGLPETIITAMINHRPASLPPAQVPAVNPPVAAPDYSTAQAPPASAPAPEEPAPAAPAPPPQVTYNYFYSTLSPYGSWVWIDGYGWCWQPTVAVIEPGWRPYSDRGRWLYSDAGWYWQSYYTWGWAPFHYGRWFSPAGYGWVWAPDLLWGPSWVSWRYSDVYYGWAPLPPGAYFTASGLSYGGVSVGVSFGFGLSAAAFTFVDAAHFYDPFLWRHYVPRAHIVNVYNNTTIINNYAQNTVNKTVINNGVDPNRIASATRSEIRKVHVAELPSGSGIRPDRVTQNGSQLVVYRPQSSPSSGRSPAGSADSRNRSSSVALASNTSGLVPSRNSSSPGIALVPHADYALRHEASAGTRSEPRALAGNPTSSSARLTQPQVAQPSAAGSAVSPQTGVRTPAESGSAAAFQPQIIRTPTQGSSRQEMPKYRITRQPATASSAPAAAPRADVRSPVFQNRFATPEVFRDSQPAPTTPVANRGPIASTGSGAGAPARLNPRVTAPSAASSSPQLGSRLELMKPPAYPVPSSVEPTYRSQEIFPNRGEAFNSAPAVRSYNTPQMPSRQYAPTYSAPASGYSVPQPSYSAPARVYSAPTYAPSPGSYPQPSYSPRTYNYAVPSAPARPAYSYSPPSRSYSAPVGGGAVTRSEPAPPSSIGSAASPRSPVMSPGVSGRTRSWQ